MPKPTAAIFIQSGDSGQGSFRGERVGTSFPLLKCLETHCEPFSGQKYNQIARFCIYNLKNFWR